MQGLINRVLASPKVSSYIIGLVGISYSMGTSPHQGLINRVLASPKASSCIIGLVATE